jgi:hypothetical protein
MLKGPTDESNSTSKLTTDRERQFLKGLDRYADAENLTSAESVKDLPKVFHVIVDGRVCCGVHIFWESLRELVRDVLRRDFDSTETNIPSAQDDGDRLRKIDIAAIGLLLPQFPEKFDAALEQLVNQVLLETMQRQANALGVEVPLKRFAENILKTEARRVKERLGVRRGSPKGARRPKAAAFSPQTFPTKLNQTIREIVCRSDSEPTRSEVARRLRIGSAKTLDRTRQNFGDKRKWRVVLAEAMSTK